MIIASLGFMFGRGTQITLLRTNTGQQAPPVSLAEDKLSFFTGLFFIHKLVFNVNKNCEAIYQPHVL